MEDTHSLVMDLNHDKDEIHGDKAICIISYFLLFDRVIKWRLTTDLLGLMFSFKPCKGIGLIMMRLMNDTMG